jgi:nucleoid-associated protein YgaU
MANPKDPDSLSLAGSSTAGTGKPAGGKPDFSNVRGGSDTVPDTSGGGGGTGRPDFSNVQGGSDTVADTVGGGGQQSYVVEKGDNLSSISKRFYGKSKFWKQIFDANRDTIENPDLIYPGQTIVLPAIDTDGDGDSGD